MRLHIETMTCGACVRHVEEAIRTVDPAAAVEADTASRIVTVATAAEPDAIRRALAADGYDAELVRTGGRDRA